MSWLVKFFKLCSVFESFHNKMLGRENRKKETGDRGCEQLFQGVLM